MRSWQLWRANSINFASLLSSNTLPLSQTSRSSLKDQQLCSPHFSCLFFPTSSLCACKSLYLSRQTLPGCNKEGRGSLLRILYRYSTATYAARASMDANNVYNGVEGDNISESGTDLQRSFQIVVAATREHGIGKNGKLPWNLPSDLKYFKKITSETLCSSKRNAVIMGRRTWESIPSKFRPLPGRLNVVLSRSSDNIIRAEAANEDVLVSKSLKAALQMLATPQFSGLVESVFIIGGGEVFREAMSSPHCDAIHLTEIETIFECDTFMPAVDSSLFRLWYASFPNIENSVRLTFTAYVRTKLNKNDGHSKIGSNLLSTSESWDGASTTHLQAGDETFNRLPKSIARKHEEYQYLSLIQDILDNGVSKGDRTGTGTLSKFGCQMRFNLRKSFPLFTTKRVFWRGVVGELLWFISGSTNAKVLQDKGINIWNGNASREYLDSVGLQHREEGDLGPVYGFQWRHFGARYVDMHTDYSGQGFDQLADVIQKIKSAPDDRRIVLSAWNPADLNLMALPPCHMFAQFYVANGELSCQMYQRSCDMGLGVPFNVACYSLLTCIVAHVCDLVPGDFVHILGDAHVYKNHIEPLQHQVIRVPKPFPILEISTSNKDIDSFKAVDFNLIGYESHERIAMKMAV
ncbi:hypothetical protein O6H91_05G027800 [Diphasiastrum complanatum]|uniref:Uncharacterized protein n=2 Tax=Diphasiastrum complanatum TaxID=34168 RepID=A0ACC2DLS1_DIPCM|nr:hypothetical protein O6H91_05G027700 [Diphasiastrum complanatum]KAJ7555238.1 hypothetical protein O6H91_05G027800 [Diphasiastrum complanatum]